MNLPHHLQKHPSGVFYFRLIVPKRLQQQAGYKVIKKSLGTRSPAEAKLLAYTLAAYHLSALRKGAGMDLKKLLEAAKGASQYTITTPQGFSIQADGVDDHRRAMEALEKIGMGGSLPPPPTTPRSGGPQGSANPISLDEASRKYLATIKSTSVRKTFIGREKALADFVGWKKPRTPVEQITRIDLAEFNQFMVNQGQAKPTIALKFGYIKQFFAYCQKSGYYPSQDNPAAGQVSYTKRERSFRKKLGFEAFTDAEVSKILAALPQKKPPIYWSVLIGLYTGARVNEVAQLGTADFFEEDGLPCFKITDEGAGQKLKTVGSERTLPIHPRLIELGLLTYVEQMRGQGCPRIFPKLSNAINGYGNAVSKGFTRLLNEQGIKPVAGMKGFHSFRKTINHKMQTGKVPPDVRAQYLGHDLDDEHYQAYSRKYSVSELAEVIFPAILNK